MESKFGKRIAKQLDWKIHTVVGLKHLKDDIKEIYILPNIGDLSSSCLFGILGMLG